MQTKHMKMFYILFITLATGLLETTAKIEEHTSELQSL